jgi:hypothetical protein
VSYDEELESEADALAMLQAAELDRRQRYPDPFPHQRRSALVEGFSLHAGVRVHENDRVGLERLCRYLLRPPLAVERLTRGEEGQLLYRMKRPRDGSLSLSLTPQQLIARLATLVAPPRVHAVRYHGLFAPRAKERSRVVPEVPAAPAPPPATAPPLPSALTGLIAPTAAVAPSTASETGPQAEASKRRYWIPWALLLQKVFAIDALHCPHCGGSLQILAVIANPAVAKRILDHLGLDSKGPPITARAQGPPEPSEPPDYDVADPVYPD